VEVTFEELAAEYPAPRVLIWINKQTHEPLKEAFGCCTSAWKMHFLLGQARDLALDRIPLPERLTAPWADWMEARMVGLDSELPSGSELEWDTDQKEHDVLLRLAPAWRALSKSNSPPALDPIAVLIESLLKLYRSRLNRAFNAHQSGVSP